MKKKINPEPWFQKQSNWFIIIIAILLQGVFFFFITVNNVYTETYDLQRFSTSNATIRSPITIENEQETARKVREAVQQVEDRYSISPEVTNERLGYSEEILDAIIKLKAEAKQSEDGEDASPTQNNGEIVERLRQILSEDIVLEVESDVFITLLNMGLEELEEGMALFIESVEEVLESGVRLENIQTARSLVEEEIKYSAIDTNLKSVLIELSRFIIIENSFFDLEETNEARKVAASNADPVMINAGEIIVVEGQIITNEIYEELSLVGLLNDERNFYPVFGLILLLLLISGIAAFEINLAIQSKTLNKGMLIAVLAVSVIVVTLMKVVSLYSTDGNHLFYVTPAAVGVLLLRLLINERLAIVMAGLYAILSTVIFNGLIPGALNVEAGIYFFLSQLAGIIFLVNVKDRLAVLKAGLGMGIVNIITVLIFLFLSFEKYSLVDLFTQSAFGLSAAFLSAVLTVGLLPFFEATFGILTDIKLLQLSSPNQPLLKKLLTEAPGTYHHSVMVANLSETACEAVGANGLLARVGAYYHDIGKTLRPRFFVENQLTSDNPHDFIKPKESVNIIIGHPYDGAEMLEKEKVPKEIVEIARTHHGTSLLKFFYYKEKEQNPNVEEAEFRYPGPKPSTKESCIISICDSIEAAVRSLEAPTKEQIEEIVSSIMKDRISDGQLDESPLTLAELKTIQQTICETLKGIYHSRIQYPMKEEK